MSRMPLLIVCQLVMGAPMLTALLSRSGLSRQTASAEGGIAP